MRLLQKALTFDDVLLVPAHSQILPRDVSLATRLTRNITLNLPLLSAAMDTVTEGRLAIAMAQEGGIGIIHKNLSPKAQAAEVARVKRFESGILKDPITVSPLMTVRDVIEITRQYKISGLPVIDRAGKGTEQHVDTLAVLQAEQRRAVFVPSAGGLVGFARQQGRQQDLLAADRVHLLAHDVLDRPQHPQAQG